MNNLHDAMLLALDAKKQSREEEANVRGYRIKWDTPNNKVTIMTPWGDGGVFGMRLFLLSKYDIKSFFNKYF